MCFILNCDVVFYSFVLINSVLSDLSDEHIDMNSVNMVDEKYSNRHDFRLRPPSYNVGYGNRQNMNKMGYINRFGYNAENMEYAERVGPTRAPFNDTHVYFQGLENFEQNASPAAERQYPWLGRVVLARAAGYPLLGAASCLQPRLFLAAARSVHAIKIKYAVVVYQNTRLLVKAVVLPSKATKQMFDDVALIVVEQSGFKGSWATVSFFNRPRTDPAYYWFEEAIKGQSYKVVGYAIAEARRSLPGTLNEYQLVEIPVIVDINICQQIYGKDIAQGFYVPCYHSCSYDDYRKKDSQRHPECTRYLGTEGGVVINTKTNEALGVATWGVIFTPPFQLPVGFAVPNGDSFPQDLACAQLIRDDTSEGSKGYYQNLCDTKTG